MKISISTVIRYGLYALLALTPIITWHAQSAFLSYDKTIFGIAAFSLLLILCLVDCVRRKSINFEINRLDTIVVFFTIIFILAAIFSHDRALSIIGDGLRVSFSAAAVTVLMLWYFLLRRFIGEKKRLFYPMVSIVIGMVAVIIYELARNLIPISLPEIHTQSFTALSLNTALVVIGTGLLYMLANRRATKIIASVGFVLTSILLFWLGNQFSLLFVIVFFFFFILSSSFKSGHFNNRFIGGLTLYMFLVTLVLILPVRGWLGQAPIIDVQLPLQYQWEITTQALQKEPLLGYGPQNFSEPFYAFKPVAYNLSVLWQAGFNRAGSMVAELAATTGILGLVTYLLIFIVAVIWGVRSLRGRAVASEITEIKEYVSDAAAISLLIAFAIGSFIYQYDWYQLLIIFALLAVVAPLQGGYSVKISKKLNPVVANMVLYIGLLLIILPTYYILSMICSNRYLAYYNPSADAAVPLERQIEDVKSAQERYRWQATHYANLTNLYMAQYLAMDEKTRSLSSRELQAKVMEQFDLAESYAGNSYQDLLELRSSMIAFARLTNSEAVDLQQIHERLKKLDPNNPELYYLEANDDLQLLEQGILENVQDPQNTGVSSQISAQLRQSITINFEKALELKPDYAQAYYRYGELFFFFGEYEKAEEYYSKALLLAPVNKDYLLAVLDALAQQGKAEEGLRLVNRYLEDNDNDQELLDYKEEFERQENK